MAKGKKAFGGVPETFMQIIGIFAFIILALAIFSFCTRITSSFKNTKDSLTILKTELEDVANNYQVGGGKSVNIKMDSESAIIGFNPAKNFMFYKFGSGVNEEKTFASRFDSCVDDKFCICVCAGFELVPEFNNKGFLEKNEVSCKKNECLNSDSVIFKDKILIGEMFDYSNNPVYADWEKNYWGGGFIIIRSNSYSMQNLWSIKAPNQIFGYHNIDNIKFVIKKSENPNVVEFCFKDDCFDIQNIN